MNRKLWVIFIVIFIIAGSILTYTVVNEKPKKNVYEETVIDFEISTVVKNLGTSPALDIPLRLALPYQNLSYQEVLSIEYSEKPLRLTNDSWGNRFAHFNIVHIDPSTSYNISIYTRIKLLSTDYNLNKKYVEDTETSGEDYERYLQESRFINTKDPSITRLAEELRGESDDIIDTAWNTYEWVIDNIAYQQVPGEYDARTTLKNGEGGSAELSNLLTALLRANKIPARRISGWGNHFSEGENIPLTRFSHGWTEFYLPGYGWIPVDVTWGKNHKFDSFASSDDSHIVMTVGAGIHFFRRGDYSVPYGDTELDSDYSLNVMNVDVKNLSQSRTVITYIIFIAPAAVIVFLIYKRLQVRKG